MCTASSVDIIYRHLLLQALLLHLFAYLDLLLHQGFFLAIFMHVLVFVLIWEVRLFRDLSIFQKTSLSGRFICFSDDTNQDNILLV